MYSKGAYMYVYIYIYTIIQLLLCFNIYIYKQIVSYIYIYIYVCMCVYVCVSILYIYIYPSKLPVIVCVFVRQQPCFLTSCKLESLCKSALCVHWVCFLLHIQKINYFTSCDPHHDIYTFSYWQIFWHSI